MSDKLCERCGKPMGDAEAWAHGYVACIEHLKAKKAALEQRVKGLEEAIAEAVQKIAWEGDYGAIDTLKAALDAKDKA